jgi:protein kinase A
MAQFREPSARLPSMMVSMVTPPSTVRASPCDPDGDYFPSTSLDRHQRHHVHRLIQNVYQQPLDFANDDDSVEPTIHDGRQPVTQEERDIILKALQNNFVFSDLSIQELEPLIEAFAPVEYAKIGDVIIHQGEPGDYFYVLVSGRVTFHVNGKWVGKADTTAANASNDAISFGELALLYTCPRAATVIADEVGTKVLRVDHKTFRRILQKQMEQSSIQKCTLLANVPFCTQYLSDADRMKLSLAMIPRVFSADEVLVRKGDSGDSFYIIESGTVECTDICVGNSPYQNVTLGPGEYFGELALLRDDQLRSANVIGRTPGVVFTIDRETFSMVVGDASTLILRGQDARKLSAMPFFSTDSVPQGLSVTLEQYQRALADLVIDQHWSFGETICYQGELCSAAMYLVRQGEIRVNKTNEDDTTTVVVGAEGYVGNELLELASSPAASGILETSAKIVAPYTVTVTQDCVCGVLTWECIADTLNALNESAEEENQLELNMSSCKSICNIELKDLQKHMIVGQGTFGQCWLVSEKCREENRTNSPLPYALKIQSKYELFTKGQAAGVVREKNIMQRLNHPFIIKLVSSYADHHFLYMLMEFVQGGELFSVLHQHDENTDGLSEESAKFYSLCIASALAYLHRPPHQFVFRDLKPENVMIDLKGYPKLIDFGFCKSVLDKTFTLCGTPGYLSPEIIMTRGHNVSTDHWSLGILIFEMLTLGNPFFTDADMDQITLFQRIVVNDFAIPEIFSQEASDLVRRLLVKDPTRRLGSLARGELDILHHTWFNDIDLPSLHRREILAPWIPSVADPFDTSCFDDWSDLEDIKTKVQPAVLSESVSVIFEDFCIMMKTETFESPACMNIGGRNKYTIEI